MAAESDTAFPFSSWLVRASPADWLTLACLASCVNTSHMPRPANFPLSTSNCVYTNAQVTVCVRLTMKEGAGCRLTPARYGFISQQSMLTCNSPHTSSISTSVFYVTQGLLHLHASVYKAHRQGMKLACYFNQARTSTTLPFWCCLVTLICYTMCLCDWNSDMCMLESTLRLRSNLTCEHQ